MATVIFIKNRQRFLVSLIYQNIRSHLFLKVSEGMGVPVAVSVHHGGPAPGPAEGVVNWIIRQDVPLAGDALLDLGACRREEHNVV